MTGRATRNSGATRARICMSSASVNLLGGRFPAGSSRCNREERRQDATIADFAAWPDAIAASTQAA
jgi:hypothetical protein